MDARLEFQRDERSRGDNSASDADPRFSCGCATPRAGIAESGASKAGEAGRLRGRGRSEIRGRTVKTGIFVKLLGVLAIHLAMIGLYWAIVSFVLATQDNLSPSVLDRTEGDVQRIAANIAEVSGAMLSSGLVA